MRTDIPIYLVPRKTKQARKEVVRGLILWGIVAVLVWAMVLLTFWAWT
jgi:hypothetical protein